MSEPLSPTLQERANASLGNPLRDVRIHTDEAASRAANQLSARGFTIGRDVYFKTGMFEPRTHDGLRLIGHELSHVIQQRHAAKSDLGSLGNRHEREADVGGAYFATFQRAPAISMAGPASTLHCGVNSLAVQREVEGTVKIKDSLELFTPIIEESVGRGGINRPGDVTVVQMLLNGEGYNLEVNGNIEASNDSTAAAIEDFQRRTFPGWKEDGYDGLVDPGQNTWNALTGNYFEPDTTVARPRTQFETTRNIMLSPAVIEDDPALNTDRANAKQAGLDTIPAKGAKHVENVLQKYYDMGISIDNFYISSHGASWEPYFKIGNGENDKITKKKIPTLSGWKNLMGFDTTLIVTACHVGGGVYPDRGEAFTKELATTLGVKTYTSRSWVSSSAGWTFQRGNAASLDKPTDLREHLEAHPDTHPNQIRFLGQWLVANPGEKPGDETTTRVIEGLEYDGEGGVREAEERFPDWSQQDLADYEKLVESL